MSRAFLQAAVSLENLVAVVDPDIAGDEEWAEIGIAMLSADSDSVELAGEPYSPLDCFRTSLRLTDENPRAWFGAAAALAPGQALNGMGRPLTARQCYLRALALKKDWAAPWLALGNMAAAQSAGLRQSMSFAADPEAMSWAVASIEYCELFLAAEGTVELDDGTTVTALQCFTRAAEADPTCADAWFTLGAAIEPWVGSAEVQGEETNAVDCIGRAADILSGDGGIGASAADCLSFAPCPMLDVKVAWLSLALRLLVEDKGVVAECGEATMDAVTAATRAVDLDPESCLAWMTAGLCLGHNESSFVRLWGERMSSDQFGCALNEFAAMHMDAFAAAQKRTERYTTLIQSLLDTRHAAKGTAQGGAKGKARKGDSSASSRSTTELTPGRPRRIAPPPVFETTNAGATPSSSDLDDLEDWDLDDLDLDLDTDDLDLKDLDLSGLDDLDLSDTPQEKQRAARKKEMRKRTQAQAPPPAAKSESALREERKQHLHERAARVQRRQRETRGVIQTSDSEGPARSKEKRTKKKNRPKMSELLERASMKRWETPPVPRPPRVQQPRRAQNTDRPLLSVTEAAERVVALPTSGDTWGDLARAMEHLDLHDCLVEGQRLSLQKVQAQRDALSFHVMTSDSEPERGSPRAAALPQRPFVPGPGVPPKPTAPSQPPTSVGARPYRPPEPQEGPVVQPQGSTTSPASQPSQPGPGTAPVTTEASLEPPDLLTAQASGAPPPPPLLPPPSDKRYVPLGTTLGSRNATGFPPVALHLDTVTGAAVAIKYAADETVERELGFQQRAAHPHVLAVVEALPGQLVLEWAALGSVDHIIGRTNASLPEPTIRRYLHGLAKALAHIHAAGVVHCDVKAQNLLVTSDGTAKLADFGAAVEIPCDQGPEGTPCFMSPEAFSGDPPAPPRDVWAWACTGVQMLTGREPYAETGATTAEALLGIIGINEELPMIPDHCGAELRALLLRCLASDVDARPTAAQLVDDPLFV